MHQKFQIPIRQKSPEDRLIHHRDRLEKLGLLRPKFLIILVGGTNGKGSTSHTISRIFMEAGFKVGLNTSPHLVCFNERVRINEIPLSDTDLEHYLAKINQDFIDFPLGFNEYSFLAGLYAFIDQDVDLAVFEIGLGGRLDPANLLPAEISVISNIDYDHTQILGDTLAKIAFEKAGIFKFHKSIVCGSLFDPEAIQVIETQAQQKQATLYWELQDFSFSLFQKIYDLPEPHILKRNAALGIQTALLARNFLAIPDEKLASVLQNAIRNLMVPGRLQPLPWKHPLLLDVCHNPGGVEVLKDYLLAHSLPGKTYALFAVSETKDCEKMLKIMAPVIDYWFFPVIADLREFESLRLMASTLIPTERLSNIQDLEQAIHEVDLALSADPGRLVIFGSFYLAGSVLEFFRKIEKGRTVILSASGKLSSPG